MVMASLAPDLDARQKDHEACIICSKGVQSQMALLWLGIPAVQGSTQRILWRDKQCCSKKPWDAVA